MCLNGIIKSFSLFVYIFLSCHKYIPGRRLNMELTVQKVKSLYRTQNHYCNVLLFSVFILVKQ